MASLNPGEIGIDIPLPDVGDPKSRHPFGLTPDDVQTCFRCITIGADEATNTAEFQSYKGGYVGAVRCKSTFGIRYPFSPALVPPICNLNIEAALTGSKTLTSEYYEFPGQTKDNFPLKPQKGSHGEPRDTTLIGIEGIFKDTNNE